MSNSVAAAASPSERANARCASRISASEDDGSGVILIDIGRGWVYLAIVPIRDLVNKRPGVRLRRDRDYSGDG
jgi:hypothetical protein